jgi:N-acetylmuramoyl-L-alanine amidase CwlA
MVPIKIRLDNDDHYDDQNKIEYIVIHDTGNVTDTDEGNANYFCTGSRSASAHYFVDDDSITQVVLDKDGSFHCGDGNGAYGITNRNSLGIEMCRVNGVVTETTLANTRDLILAKMKEYNVPLDKVVRHYDASRKICPRSLSENNWSKWWDFKASLESALNPTPVSVGEWLRVRSNWLDIKTQKGAYTVLQNAIDCANANPGYEVYDSTGVQVYPVLEPVVPEVVAAPMTPKYDEIPFDASILRVQKALNRLMFKGKNGLRLSEDGKNGVNTQFAIKTFQSVMGLDVDGVAGPKTWDAIDDIFSKPYDAVSAPHYEHATRYIQWRIGVPVNGVYNWVCSRGVAIWQGQNHLKQDGETGLNTWLKLIG